RKQQTIHVNSERHHSIRYQSGERYNPVTALIAALLQFPNLPNARERHSDWNWKLKFQTTKFKPLAEENICILPQAHEVEFW
uniref:Uncharacterized protein n=1 Tax=Onchocerca volvulus TaxID=6282 RepID=A0A8R1TTZ6_ONCVO